MTIARKIALFAERASWIRRMFEEGAHLKARVGADNVCDFTLGNPDLEPPAAFRETLRRLVEQDAGGHHRYMPNCGLETTRSAVAGTLRARHGLPFGPEHVVLTVGAAGGLNVALKAILDPGDEVLILAPYFAEYPFYIDNHGGVTKVVPTDERFDIDAAAVEEAIGERTRAVVINSPNNPTGRVYPEDSLRALGRVLAAHGDRRGRPIYLIADDPYSGIVFDGVTVPSPFAAHRHAIVVTSYSKDLGLPGERIGYAALSPEIPGARTLFDAMTFTNRTLGFVNAPALMQRVIAELQGVAVDAGVYQRRRDLFSVILRETGYRFVEPEGAFYLFPRSPLDDDVAFVRLLAEQRVLAVPGSGFGAPGHFRLAFCVGEDVIERSRAGFAAAFEAAAAS